MDPLAVVDEFINAINQHDVRTLVAMMTENHRFVDSLGNEVKGHEAMRQSWNGYFAMVPDYELRIDQRVTVGNMAVLLGKAGGTYWTGGEFLPENKWQTPIAIRAVVRDGLVHEWQVYADNEPIRKLMKPV